MYPAFKELLSLFNAHKVKSLGVGGYPVSFHAQPRATKDLDILIKANHANAAAVYAALAKFGAPHEELKPEDFIEKGKSYRLGRPPLMIDNLPEIRGVDFDAVWGKRVEAEIDSGLQVPFIDAIVYLNIHIVSWIFRGPTISPNGKPSDLAQASASQNHWHRLSF